jgi:hypothetical protein
MKSGSCLGWEVLLESDKIQNILDGGLNHYKPVKISQSFKHVVCISI